MQTVQLLGHLLTLFILPVLLLCVSILPLLPLVWILHRRKKVYKSEAEDPFTQLPLRPPGESLRLRIEELSDELATHLFGLCMAGALSVTVRVVMPDNVRWHTAGAMLVVMTGTTLIEGRKILRLVRELWDHRLGFTGERVVGEELNQLLAAGFRVFHDVPFENKGKKFNIDHVLVGPHGVFAVETKTRRKPSDVKGLAKAKVFSDGERLQFPKYTETDSIAQARRNAATLGSWLSQAIGEPVKANAILTIPGWSVERTKPCDVNVLRPDEIKRSFVRPNVPFNEQKIQRIAHQLTNRCQMTKEMAG